MSAFAFDFLFSVQLSDEARFDALVTELSTSLVRNAGCQTSSVDGVVAQLHGALLARTDSGPQDCRVQFRSTGGELAIDVSFADGRTWHTSCRIA